MTARAHSGRGRRHGHGIAALRALGVLGVLVCALAGPAQAARDTGGHELKDEVARALTEIDAWDTEGALKILERLVAEHPQAPETAWIRGKVLFEQGKYAEAVKAFDEAKEKSGGTGPALEQDRKLAQAALEETLGGTVQESAHFVVIAKAKKDALLLPWTLEGLEAAYTALTQDLGYQPPMKVRVEIYDAPKALAHVSPLTVAEIKASGTIALCKYNRLMITSPRALLRGYPWMDTLSHEFVHFLVTRKGRNTVPIWLQEGLAKFLETRWRGPPGQAVDELSLQLLEAAAKKKDLIPFAAMHPSIAKLPTQEKAALAFAEVESAMRMLYARGGQTALTELVAAMAAGFTDQQAVAQAYGKTFPQFESDWRAEVARPRAKKPGERREAGPQKKLVFNEDVRGKKDDSPVPEPKDPLARRAVRLGELFYARGRWQAAAIEYGKARALLPQEDVVVARRYAVAQVQLGNFLQAQEALERAVERDSTEASVQLLLGQVRLRLGDFAGAKVALTAAVAVDPFDPALQASLQKLGTETKDAALTARAGEALKLLTAREGPAGATETPHESGNEQQGTTEGGTMSEVGVELVPEAQQAGANGQEARPYAGATDAELIGELATARARIAKEIGKRVIGQAAVVDQLLCALFSRGHCLFVGVPGLAKTLLISTLAESLSLSFNRIQFTPDLMPSDITGTDVLEEDHTTGRRVFRFVQGPVFANVLLADEINRTPPKTQAALLQAMQEKRVTAGGRTYKLPEPFLVFATQNPIEQEGTYPLPEAQLDRFMFMVDVGYPSEAEELEIVRQTTSGTQPTLTQVLSPAQIQALQELVLRVPAADHVIAAAVALVRRTRPPDGKNAQKKSHDPVAQYVSWGAGPRASQALILGAKARAALDGRPAATVDDVRALAEPVLRHRVLTNFHAEAEGVDSRSVIEQLVRELKA